MTDKRFTIANVLTKCSGLRDNGKLMTFNEVVDLLNEQHEDLTELKEIGDYQADRIKELTDENTKLEEQLRNLRRLANELYMEGSE